MRDRGARATGGAAGPPGRLGQAAAEWVGLVALVALALASAAALAGWRPPGPALARAVAERLVCAVRLQAPCRSDPALAGFYGGELAALVRDNAPRIFYEDGMRALPVDFRRCRRDACAEGPDAGRAARSLAGRRVTAFIHVIDCREPAAVPRRGGDCSGPRRGNLYIQYWLYYPGSATAEGSAAPGLVRAASAALGRPSFHDDDWESFQVRIGPDGAVDARASSHHGYNGASGIGNWASDLGAAGATRAAESAGLRRSGGWAPSQGALYVSGGSHAGHASERSLRRSLAAALAWGALEARGERRAGSARRRRLARRIERRLFGPGARYTPRGSLRLVPLEPIAGGGGAAPFAVRPPWRKRVWADPEYGWTD